MKRFSVTLKLFLECYYFCFQNIASVYSCKRTGRNIRTDLIVVCITTAEQIEQRIGSRHIAVKHITAGRRRRVHQVCRRGKSIAHLSWNHVFVNYVSGISSIRYTWPHGIIAPSCIAWCCPRNNGTHRNSCPCICAGCGFVKLVPLNATTYCLFVAYTWFPASGAAAKLNTEHKLRISARTQINEIKRIFLIVFIPFFFQKCLEEYQFGALFFYLLPLTQMYGLHKSCRCHRRPIPWTTGVLIKDPMLSISWGIHTAGRWNPLFVCIFMIIPGDFSHDSCVFSHTRHKSSRCRRVGCGSNSQPGICGNLVPEKHPSSGFEVAAARDSLLWFHSITVYAHCLPFLCHALQFFIYFLYFA